MTPASPPAPTVARPLPATSAHDLVASLPGVVWEADATDYRMTYVSPRARDLLGLDPVAWVEERDFWESHLHPDERAQVIGEVDAALGELRPATFEYRFRTGDGSYCHIRDVVQVVAQPNGHRRLVGFMFDVSGEAAERESRNRLAAIVASAADAGYATDLGGVYLAWNDAASRLYGWTRDEVLGRSAYELVDPCEHESIRDWIRRVAEGEVIGPVDATHRGRDGRLLTLSVTASPVRDANGTVTGVATIARDVSGERRLAEERQALEAELFQAQKLEAIGRLAGGIAHDFNNMLTAISGYAGLVASSLDGPLLEDQQQVLHAAERAADLTRRLLAFARPASLDPRPVDVDAVLREAYGMVRRMVPERIAFDLRTGAGCLVLADPVELEQLFLNLVVNAADAIDDVGRIDVRTMLREGPPRADGTPDRTFLLTVADTGAGMDGPTRSRIFEPFFTTKRLGSGTGLGLATVHAIVHRAGGSIDVRSAPGAGTTFVIAMPAANAAREPGVAPAERPQGGSERLLVVDDAVEVGTLTARILRGAGYDVTVSTAPLEVLRDGVAGIDAVVSDVIMPGLSGPELVARLGGDLPAVFISGYTGNHVPPGLAEGPHRAFVAKPFSARSLLQAVREVLDARTLAGSGAVAEADEPAA